MADCNSIETLLNTLTLKINEIENRNNSRIDALERALGVLQSAVNSLKGLVDSYGAAIDRTSQAIANLINSFANQNKPRDGKDGKDGQKGDKGDPGKDAKPFDPTEINSLIAALQLQILLLGRGLAALAAQFARLALRPGIPGRPGLNGINGRNGAKGDRGSKGDKGDRGSKGDRGEIGEEGEIGDKGDKGVQGVRGERGIKGDRGEIGEEGEKGVTGIRGVQGVRGERGIKGDPGKPGQNGQPGKPGQNGQPGQPGQNGQPGNNGASGKPGAKGDKGDEGMVTIVDREVVKLVFKEPDLRPVLSKIAELRTRLIFPGTVNIPSNCDVSTSTTSTDLPSILVNFERKLTAIEKLICDKQELESYDLGTYSEPSTTDLMPGSKFIRLEVLDFPLGIGRRFGRASNQPNNFQFGFVSFQSDLGLSPEQNWEWINSYFYPDKENVSTRLHVYTNIPGISYKLTGYKTKI